MKRIVIFLLTTFFIAGALYSGNQPKYVIKFATLAPEGTAWLKVMRQYDEAVRKATNGEVGFKIYGGGVAGDEKAVLRKMRFNQFQSAGFTGVGLGEILPEVRIFDSPMLFQDYNEVDKVIKKFTPEFEAKFEEKGFVLLGWTEVGFIYMFSQTPLTKHADLKKARMWTWEGDPVASATFGSLQVTPVPLAITDVLTSLQTNLIDAVYTAPTACVALQWFTKLKYVTDVRLANALGVVLISKKTYLKLPPEYRKILKDLGKEYMKKLIDLSRKDNEESLQLMLDNGLQKVKVDPADMQFFNEAGAKARRSMVGKLYSEELLNRVEAEVNSLRNGK